MNRAWYVFFITTFVCFFSSCATIKEKMPLDVDQSAQAFFDDLQKSDNHAAYGLLAKGISQRISFEQFDQFMQTIREQWGRLVTDETEVLPFHRRVGEENFIPMDVTPQQIKRYVFDVKFDNADMNFDLTLAPQNGAYKIVWFSVWGSSIYMTKQVQEKIEELFSGSDSPGTGQQ